MKKNRTVADERSGEKLERKKKEHRACVIGIKLSLVRCSQFLYDHKRKKCTPQQKMHPPPSCVCVWEKTSFLVLLRSNSFQLFSVQIMSEKTVNFSLAGRKYISFLPVDILLSLFRVTLHIY
jgi:hypothetical protein